jgi:hypothetical protein
MDPTADDHARPRLEDALPYLEAVERVITLHRLGPENGTGATVWARAIRDNLELHGATRDLHPNMAAEDVERIYATSFQLIVAIDQVLRYETRVRSVTGDADLQKARARFDKVCPDANELRDLVAHLDEYAVGTGLRQTGKAEPPLTLDASTEPLIHWVDDRGTTVELAGHRIEIRATAAAAVELAAEVERVRAKWQRRAEQEADEELHRRRNTPG